LRLHLDTKHWDLVGLSSRRSSEHFIQLQATDLGIEAIREIVDSIKR